MMYEVFMQRVMHRTGLDDPANAREFVDETLHLLGEGLADVYALPIAEKLPKGPADALVAREVGGRGLTPDGLYNEISLDLGLSLSKSMEWAQVVFQVVGEALDRDGRDLLKEGLDEAWHELFSPREPYTRPPRRDHGDRRTLATGSPGSSKPLSESDVAHSNSVAATNHPHEGDKLSSSRDKPQGRTLADGRPGSSRPISGA